VLGHQQLQLGDELGRPSELQVGVDPLAERDETQLLEAADLRGGHAERRQIGERRTPPQAERLAQ
jgi:hypothetical protein